MGEVKSNKLQKGKNKFFFEVLDMLKDVYRGESNISEAEMELLAQELTDSVNKKFAYLDLVSIVYEFWTDLLSNKEDISFDSEDIDEEVSSLAQDYYVVEGIIDLLKINEKNAHDLFDSFVHEYTSYNAFVRLASDFRKYLTKDELRKVFDQAKAFEKELVDCYR